MSDLISRQDAIKACFDIRVANIYDIADLIEMLPSVETLTDAEQRIFLKAIEREREVCEKTDAEWADDETALNLVRVCDAIERKVKGALWTT